jgi:hypothetical protein
MPEQKDTTHTLIERELIVYRRERSGIWQCRFKVDDVWQRASTKQRDFKKGIVFDNSYFCSKNVCFCELFQK